MLEEGGLEAGKQKLRASVSQKSLIKELPTITLRVRVNACERDSRGTGAKCDISLEAPVCTGKLSTLAFFAPLERGSRGSSCGSPLWD